MSQKMASASALGSTTAALSARSAGSTGRHSSPPEALLDQLVPDKATAVAIMSVNKTARDFRGRYSGGFMGNGPLEFLVFYARLQNWQENSPGLHLCVNSASSATLRY